MNLDFGKYYEAPESGRRERAYAWATAIGLQDVDGLKPSKYMIATARRVAQSVPRADAPERQEGELYEIGLLRRGMAYRLGPAAELKALPAQALEAMLLEAISRDHKADIVKEAAESLDDDYLRTLDEITARLGEEGTGKREQGRDG